MGRWEVSVASEMFDRQKKESGSPAIIGHEKPWKDADIARYLSSNVARAAELRAGVAAGGGGAETMCNGDDDAGEAREEWSPIRDPAVPVVLAAQLTAFECFSNEDNGASSDMDTEDDPVPPVSAKTVAAAASAAAAAAAVTAAQDVESAGVGGIGTMREFDHTVEPPLKRKRLPELGRNPVVQVTYEGLTRESKNFLQLALQNWAYWHSRSYPPGAEPRQEGLVSGTEVYSPALALEPISNPGNISVWMDKPSKVQEAKIQDVQDGRAVESKDKEKGVPLYDRACVAALPSEDLADRSDGFVRIEPEEASRCFNCGSYSHSLRDCSRPHVMAAIRNARNMLLSKRGSTPRPRTASRYYQCSPGGKFDDLKPGILGLEARKGLGIGELDPPPWLHRMRELGYPPGYLESTEDESADIEIIGEDTDIVAGKEMIEDGKVVEEITCTTDTPLVEKKMLVEFPGVNAPVPENADKKIWEAPCEAQPEQPSRGSKRAFHQISQMHNNNVESYSGPCLLSPSSSANSWMVGMGNDDSRDGSSSRSISSGRLESHSRNGSVGMECYADGNSSSLSLTSPVVNHNVNVSMDPANYWFRRRLIGAGSLAVEGLDCSNARSSVRAFQHSSGIPSGLASPIRGMFRAPGLVEPLSSPSHTYSYQNYYHNQSQISPFPILHGANLSANDAWLKAQAALDALTPNQNYGGLLASPLRTPMAASPYSGGSPHNWGMR